MKTATKQRQKRLVLGAALLTALVAFVPLSKALDSLTTGVAAYWPMDIINGGVLTPDQGPNGFDIQPYASKAVVAFNGANVVVGAFNGPHANINGRQNGTNALTTSTTQATTIGYIAPVTQVSQLTNLLVPPLNQPNWTISFWLKAAVSGANTGNRMFAIAEVPLGNGPNLLWDLTQANNDSDATQLGHFRRQAASVISGIQFLDDNGSGDQVDTVASGSPLLNVFDNNWHNITLIAQTITNVTGPIIDPTQFGSPTNGNVMIAWNSVALDSLAANATNQVDTNQNYLVQVATNVLGPWTTISQQGSSGNGSVSTFTDNNPTNVNAFYRVVKPQLRVQTRFLYVDGQPVPVQQGDSIDALLGTGAIQDHPAKTGASYRQNGYFFADAMMFGGFVRAAGEGGFVNASYSDAAVWNRALSTNDLAFYMRDGITNASVFQVPLAASIVAEYPATVQGDVDLASWTASKPPATLTLNPGNVNVTPLSSFGIGSSNLTVTANTTFNLIASRSGLSATGAVSVICVSNVQPNWRYIDSFTYLSDGPIAGQGNWLNPPRGPATPSGKGQMELSTVRRNNDAGLDGFDPNNGGNGALAGRDLHSLANTPGQTNTLFFRFYLPSAATNVDPNIGVFDAIQMTAGVSDLGILDVGINGGAGGGPQLTLSMPENGGLIDLTASSGASDSISTSPGGYDYVNDPNTGNTNGLIADHVYSVWIDVINNHASVSDSGVVGGYASGLEQTNADYYAVWLQRDDWAQRTNLFSAISCTNTFGGLMNGVVYPQGYLLSPRDYSVNNQNNTLLGPTAKLEYLFLQQSGVSGGQQMTNGVVFDDFYMSRTGTGFNTTTPVTAGSFPP